MNPWLAVLTIAVLVAVIIGIRLVTARSKQVQRERPYDVQAAEVATHFTGQPQVTYYPTYTALSSAQITQVAQSRGYQLCDEGATYKGHQYLKFRRVQ